MMKEITLVLCFLVGAIFSSYAQNFNYQAAIRDNGGNLINNQAVGVQIKLLQGGASGTTVYTETHAVTSNAYGIINLAVGTGATTDTFSTINWSTQDYWLETAIDITGGTTYVVIGASQLMSVPYANYALNSGDKAFSTTANVTSNTPGAPATDDFVFGSTQLDNIANTTTDNARVFFDKNLGAFRAGIVNDMLEGVPLPGDQWDSSNIGYGSIAMGVDNAAKSNYSVALGNNNTVEAGTYSSVALGSGNTLKNGAAIFALGERNAVSGIFSGAIGVNNTAEGNGNIAIGNGLVTRNKHAIALGVFNTEISGSPTVPNPNNPLLILGNGTNESNRSNALEIRHNGNTLLNGQLTIDGDNTGTGKEYTLPAQDGTINQVMRTDGSGNASWLTLTDNVNDADADPTNEIELPTQTGNTGKLLSTNGTSPLWIDAPSTLPSQSGQSGKVLSTDGNNASWTTLTDNVNDADFDPTNEIELPTQTGNSGKLLTTNGTSPSWSSEVSATSVTTDALTVNNLPAFAADLSGTASISGAGSYNNLGNWRTADAALPNNLFDNGNHFNEATGEFTAPVNGFYYFTAQVRYDNIQTGHVRLLLAVNSVLSLNSGLHAIAEVEEVGETINYQTLNVGGVMKLNTGDKVTVVIYSSSDTSWSISDESGFNGYLISRF